MKTFKLVLKLISMLILASFCSFLSACVTWSALVRFGVLVACVRVAAAMSSRTALVRPPADLPACLVTLRVELTVPLWRGVRGTVVLGCNRKRHVVRMGWILFMMTSSNGNIFRVTGPLWGWSIGDRWIPLTKASDAELWCFLWSAPEKKQLSKQSIRR